VEQDDTLGQSSFLHDMVVQKVQGRMVMLLSYWDGGWVQLDVSDPANPTLISRATSRTPDPLTGLTPTEGNAHQAEFSPNGKLIIGTSEDFSPYRLDPFLITTGPNAGSTRPVSSASPSRSRVSSTAASWRGRPSTAASAARRCRGDPAGVHPAGPEGQAKVVVLLRGTCFFSEKIEQAQLAGYDAVVIANHHAGAGGGDAPDAFLCGSQGHEFEPTIAAFCIGHRAFHLMFGQTPGYTDAADAPAIGAVGASVSAKAQFDGWGYVHLLDARTMQQLDAYAIDEALDPAYAQGFGDLSVHEVAVDPWRKDIAYLSYYSGGLRVIRYDEKSGITEVGAYISEEGNNFWGVEAHRLPQGTKGAGKQTLILASDRDSGLWIFTYDETGKGKGKGKSAGKGGGKPAKAVGSGKAQRMDEMPANAKGKGLAKKRSGMAG
jgi:hypothetical protein